MVSEAVMMEKSMLPVSVCVAALLCVLQLSSSQTVHRVCYVKPENSTAPCPQPCYTLQEYADNGTAMNCSFGEANTTYLFLEGVHELFENVSLNAFHVDSVSLVGNSSEGENGTFLTAEIVCYDQAGFLFKNSTNIIIKNLTFTGCGHWYQYMVLGGQAALAFYNVTNMTVVNTTVQNSTGYGLYALCAMGYVEVADSVFAFNEGSLDYDGGNVGFLYQGCSDINTPSLLSIRFSQFLYGYSEHINPLATGLSVFVWSSGVNVDIDNITAIGNVAVHASTGGNVALLLRNRTNISTNWARVRNSYLANGRANSGAGMFVSILDTPSFDTRSQNPTRSSSTSPEVLEVITIVNTQFISNHAEFEGGGLYVITHEEAGIFSPIGNVTVRDCVFYDNKLNNRIGGGVAVHLNNHYVLSYLNHSVPQFFTSLVNCTIENNALIVEENLVDTVFTGSSAVFVIENPSGVLIENCSISHNNCTGITAVWSSVMFAGNMTFTNNTGTDGGGIILCDNSYMLLRANTTVVFQDNRASHAGGGIYAENACLQSEPPCFFQLDIEIYKYPSLQDTVRVHLINNSADYAGSAIYGGSVDYCILFPQFVPDLKKHGAAMFQYIFRINQSSSDLSPISSNPYQVCFCVSNGTRPDCGIASIAKTMYPGEELSFHALTVGQHNGSASGTVLASLKGLSADSQLGNLENSQVSQKNCTEFRYKVYSSRPLEVILLQVQHSDISSGAQGRGFVQVNVALRQCPIGFTITSQTPYECGCVHTLAVHDYKCNIQSQTIHRQFPNWIGYYHHQERNPSDYIFASNENKNESISNGIVYYKHCPFDFCKAKSEAIKTGPNASSFQGDSQCAYHRTGVLCGGCRDGYSLILGSSECRRCSDRYVSLLLVFIAAGLALVLLLIVTDLNVSSGTMSGLIFYANIVQVDRAIYFDVSSATTPVSTPVYLCGIFIAWLNLDFGIKTCFYNGMDAYAKTWLQFAFPLYVWGIAAVIILLSRRFPSMAGRNPVKVLASLFLLSYAKLLRTIITSLAPAELALPTDTNETTVVKAVWQQDGNVDYLQGKHIPLFMVALGFGLMTLPYAVILLLIQWLQKTSHFCLCSWVAKMKPLLDAYTGPYKTNCRFWTGFLLLIRVGLFVIFAFPSTDPDLKLALILTTCITVQMIAWSFRGVYANAYTNILNSVFLLNLGLFSAVTSYLSHSNSSRNDQAIAICISVGTTFVLFNCILFYHTFVQIRATRKWYRLQSWLKKKRLIKYSRFGRDSATTATQGDEQESDEEAERQVTGNNATHSTIDPFDIQYREPLISSGSGSYGTSDPST